MTQDATITATVSAIPAVPATEATPAVAAVPVAETPAVAAPAMPAVAPIVVEATVAPVVTAPVVTETAPVDVAPVAPAPAVVADVATPSVAAGTITPDTNSAVGTGSEDGIVAATLVNKLDQAGLILLGIADFSEEGQALVQEVLQTGSALTKGTITDLLQYSKEMGPNSRITPVTGAPKQVALYRSLMNGINNGSNDFPIMFSTILRIVYELKTTGAFQEKLIYRYFPSMALNKADRDAFAALIHTLITLSATSGRATAMKQIDFNKLTAFGYTQAGRQRLLSFFNI